MGERAARAVIKPRKRTVRRARQARSRHTVETILEGATRILVERGWAGFTTNAVAERAGVSIGSLYEYFSCKGDLVDAIVDRHLSRAEQIVADVDARMAELHGPCLRLTPKELVDMLVGTFVSLHSDDPLLHRVLSSQVPLTDAHRTRILALQESAVDRVATLLPLDVRSRDRTASMLVGTADALIHAWIVEDGIPLPEESMRQEIGDMLSAFLGSKGDFPVYT
ncbi:TetR/AcrR family transcriptional regulator [Marivita sp. S0852]|uniref:TetR/AcrR family transcriptional regulator n=1 Tax=Marivita sp. S0852 TaxID=3373893 RepID=UPI0039819828